MWSTRKFVWMALAAIQAPALLGQNQVVVGEMLTFRSAVLGEDREIYIAKPADYSGTTERYPVLYLLDAETQFRYASGAVEFLAFADRIPRMIVVGIASGPRERRARDLTPVSSAEVDRRFTPSHGGAGKFLSFFTSELMPMVEKKYATRPYRILVGHSPWRPVCYIRTRGETNNVPSLPRVGSQSVLGQGCGG